MPSARSGIDVFLTQESYDRQITKHGQWVRWLRSQPCFCILNTGQPDPGCDKCVGRGRLFSHQERAAVKSENSAHDLSEVLPTNTPVTSVQAVRRGVNGTDEYAVTGFTDTKVTIAATAALPELPRPHQTLEVDYTYSMVQELTQAPTYRGNGVFDVVLPPVRTRNQEPVTGEVVSVSNLENTTKGVTYAVSATARSEIHAEFVDPGDEPAAGDALTATFKYANPVLALLLGVQERLRSEDPSLAIGGEAVITVPYNLAIGSGDLITQLAGFQRGTAVQEPTHGSDVDEIASAFEVHSVLRVVDAVRDYEEGTDFVLWGRNGIKWVQGGSRPGGYYSIMYNYHPTFSALPGRPMVRAGENLRLPRRVGLTVFDKVSARFDAEVR